MQLYLGTITRYYADGRPPREPLEIRDSDDIAGAVSSWRHWLNKELPHALDWNESPTAPFETAAVGEKCTGALWLLAAFARPDAPSLPNEVPDDWQARPEVQAAMECAPDGLPFAQAIKPELWLPGDHDFLFQARELSESFTWIGSSEELLRDLEAMERHWRSSLAGRKALRGEFESARAVLTRLARRSARFRLPLRRT